MHKDDAGKMYFYRLELSAIVYFIVIYSLVKYKILFL